VIALKEGGQNPTDYLASIDLVTAALQQIQEQI
jgi:hypothetical protein